MNGTEWNEWDGGEWDGMGLNGMDWNGRNGMVCIAMESNGVEWHCINVMTGTQQQRVGKLKSHYREYKTHAYSSTYCKTIKKTMQ